MEKPQCDKEVENPGLIFKKHFIYFILKTYNSI